MSARSARMLESVNANDIPTEKTVCSCGECGERIVGYRDDYGVWIECACDSGYVSGSIRAIVLW